VKPLAIMLCVVRGLLKRTVADVAFGSSLSPIAELRKN